VRLLASILVCSSAAAFSAAQTPAAPAAAPTQSFERFRIGSDTDVSPTTTGGLQLEGGGTDQPDAFNWLVEHANGGDILVIRASGTGAYNDFIAKQGATNSVETIVFHDRAASSDPYVLNRLAHAEAIFLAGGDQGNYIKYWKDTPVEDAINAAAKRGVPIGGTSAGLAVMSQFSFAALNDSIVSKDALADPYDPKVTIERDFLDLPKMRGLITDSHWVERDRLGRTVVFLARMLQDNMASPARALAIDSTTAVLMEMDGTAIVAGKTAAYFMRAATMPSVCRKGAPLSMAGIEVYRVKAGGHFNLKTWTGDGGLAYTLTVTNGVVTSSKGDLY
jgi:cyanophycinase